MVIVEENLKCSHQYAKVSIDNETPSALTDNQNAMVPSQEI